MDYYVPTPQEWERWRHLEFYPHPRFKCLCKNSCEAKILVHSHHKQEGIPSIIKEHRKDM